MNSHEQSSEDEVLEAGKKKQLIAEPTPEDFEAVRAWGMIENPLIALEDYSELKMELRWLNKMQRDALLKRYAYRELHSQRGLQKYYKEMNRPISHNKWEFLKLRKSWFIVPLEWDRFAAPDCRGIIDVGCGDGDVLQRVADHIAACWQKTGYPGHDLELVGVDLSANRTENAAMHFSSPHKKITGRFQPVDVLANPLPFEDNHFSYCVNTGVFGLLDEDQAKRMIGEICRVAEKGLYLEVLGEESPGAHPREDFSYLLEPHGFSIEQAHWVLSEPFVIEGSKDPLMSMPILRSQVFFASSDT